MCAVRLVEYTFQYSTRCGCRNRPTPACTIDMRYCERLVVDKREWLAVLGVLSTAEEGRTDAQDIVERADEPPLPTQFDWRSNETFDSCIGPVVDQGHCGSCWAVSAAEAFAVQGGLCHVDRHLVHDTR